MLVAESRNVVKKDNLNKLGSRFLSIVSIALFVITFFIADFLLFAVGGAYSLFGYDGFFNAEVLYICGTIVVVCFLLSALLSFSRFLQNVFAAFVLACFCLVFFNRFLSVDPSQFLSILIAPNYIFDNYSNIIIAILVSFVFFSFLETAKPKKVFYLALSMFVALLFYVGHLYLVKPKVAQMVEIFNYETLQNPSENAKKFVYINFESLPSYSFLRDLDDEKKDDFFGFLVKNNAKLYPNAYLFNTQKALNAPFVHNFGNKNAADSVMNNIKISSYFNFNKYKDEQTFLRKSTLYNLFKKASYDLVVYQSTDVELCNIDNRPLVDKCVDVNVANPSLENKLLSDDNKTLILISGWINSMGYNFNVPIINNKEFEGVYSVNSLEQLETAFFDIKNNKNEVFYYLDINFPGSVYAYDGFCKIKSFENWVYSRDGNISQKIKESAYLEQLQCLSVKLEDLMSQTNKSNIVYVLTSQNNAVELGVENYDFIKAFKLKNLTTFAILDPMQKNFEIDYDICAAHTLLGNYLFKKTGCDKTDFGIQGASKLDIDIELLRPFEKSTINAKDKFESFYNQYKEVGKIEQKN